MGHSKEFILQAILDGLTSSPTTDQVSDQVKSLLRCLKIGEVVTAAELMLRLNLSHKATFRKNYLNPALSAGLIEMTEPASPRSPTQKYRRIHRI